MPPFVLETPRGKRKWTARVGHEHTRCSLNTDIAMLQEFFKTTLFIIASLLPIINPPAVGFIVLSMVPHATESERAELARNITMNSLILLTLSLLLGAYVLAFFGISIPVLRVAGGLIVAVAGWKLLQSNDDSPRDGQAQGAGNHGPALRAQAFYPLTLPLTVGPGAIAVAIALGTGSPEAGPLPVHVAGVAIALAVLSIAIYVCVRYACRVQRFLGDVGTRVVMRLFAFVIFCIGVQIFWIGARGLFAAAHLVAPAG
jgi:multiple antibiotic resistance protein